MDIVEELKKDRESGAKRLEAEYKAGLLSLARRFCADESDAEELVNRTFAAVVEDIDGFLMQSSFFTRMVGILTNLHAMDRRRKSNQTVVYPSDIPQAIDEDAGGRRKRVRDRRRRHARPKRAGRVLWPHRQVGCGRGRRQRELHNDGRVLSAPHRQRLRRQAVGWRPNAKRG